MDLKHRTTQKGIMFLHGLNGLTSFSFAILFSSLSLYLTKCIQLNQTEASSIVGFFLAANFLIHLISGCIGDRFISNRALLAIAILLETIGIVILNTMVTHYYLGLSFFLAGCGLITTCINCLLTQQFKQNEDQSREKAFFYNYAAMNVGFFAGFMFGGFIDLYDSYEEIFKASNVIYIIIAIIFYKSWNSFHSPLIFKNDKSRYKMLTIGINIILIMIPILYLGLHYSYLANYLLLGAGIIVTLYVFFLAFFMKIPEDKNKIYAYLILFVSSIVFWMLHFIGPMGMAFFLKDHLQVNVLGYQIPPQWFMNLNAILVILGSPLLVIIFQKLRKKINVSVTKQFIFSLICMSLSYYGLRVGILRANEAGLVHENWIILYYVFQSIGELLIAPVGYSMIGKLESIKLQNMLMGLWMLGTGIAVTLSHYFSNIMTQTNSLDPLISNQNYIEAFSQLGIYAFVAAVILFLCLPIIERNIKEKKQAEGMVVLSDN